MTDNKEKPWPPKAYNNIEFLNSPAARQIRILCEIEETKQRFKNENIEDTLVMFGSARTLPITEALENLAKVGQSIDGKDKLNDEEEAALAKAHADVKNAPYYEAARELSKSLTEWSMSLPDKKRRFIVCSGGGPGIMEAANRGAREAGGASIGLGISLPFEQGLNKYVTHDLQFEFHYFFIRKYWFVYLAKALIAFPGGFGTMDELFESLTLIQTKKLEKKLPIILYGADFWNKILNFDAFVEHGVISPKDVDLFTVVDSVQEAHDYIVNFLSVEYLNYSNSPK